MSDVGGTLDRALAWERDVRGELARLVGARDALLVGPVSAVPVAAAIGPNGIVVACDSSSAGGARDEPGADARRRARIDVWVGSVHETLAALAGATESFDLVVIDARTPGARSHLATILDDALLAPDGVLCADHTTMPPRSSPARAGVAGNATGLEAALARDLRIEQMTLGGRDGLTLARWAR